MNMKDKIHTLLFGKTSYYTLDDMLKLGKETPLEIRVEQLRGSPTRWNSEQDAEFDYGEVPMMLNVADDMPWDIIVAPQSSAKDKNLLVSGILPISKNAEDIPAPHGNKIGNDKLILSKDGILTKYDKKAITNYFKNNKAFSKPLFF